VVAGSVRLRESGRVYNAVILADGQGRLQALYKKNFLTGGELRDGMSPGCEPGVIETAAGRIGAVVCFDLNYTEMIPQYRRLAPDILVFPSMFHGGRQMLEEEALLAGILYLYDRHKQAIRTRAGFDSFLEALRADLYTAATRTAKAASDALLQAIELSSELNTPRPPNRKESVDDIRLRLSCLIYPGFVRDAGVEHAPELPRYVQALRARLEKMDSAPQKDRTRMSQINPFWQQCMDAFARVREKGISCPALAEYRWLLEEFAVSLYSQELGTSQPVSEKRLQEVLNRINI
jgi:hypothetical protein